MHTSIGDIRQEFLNFFKNKKHRVVSSSSLIPDDDQNLLFTNAGMNQFKNIFLGIDKPLFKRVTTAQRCMRAGGKHNDLDNVGYTDRHLTFFEMLGNFSFGDYFKYEAIQFAWELLTDSKWFNLSKDRIWTTVHVCDDESYSIWKNQIGIPDERIIKIGRNKNNFCDSENFWKMGNVGPCGPCSEILYDRGDSFIGGFPGSAKECGERYIEIWNLVFIQFNQQVNGDLLSLPMLSVDTGMGLERITSVLQGVQSTYAIDVFAKLIVSISQVMKINSININRSLYVIADHIRACSFLIRDGIIPSNEGRGYVLRRIIRRAVLHGKKLGKSGAFFYQLVTPLIKNMQYIASMLYDKQDFIEEILFNEENLFAETLHRGSELLEKQLLRLSLSNNNVLNGEIAYNLYSTYGFPLELTKDICYEHNVQVDQIGFDRIMLEHKQCAKRSNQLYKKHDCYISYNIPTIFVGYQNLKYHSQIVELIQENKSVNVLSEEECGIVVLNITPFYSESGGQIGDSGELKTESGNFQVIYTKKYGQVVGHFGRMRSGHLNIREQVIAVVNQYKRKCICLNHSATHLLKAALSQIIGNHVIQKGSYINDQQLRFDFSHYKTMTVEQINEVENFVNQNIWNNLLITVDFMSIDKAKDCGVVMLLNKKYHNENEVRVLRVGDVSVELCGGTHVKSTGEIGLFIITKESSIASGIRRIEGITGKIALSFINSQKSLIRNISQTMQSDDKNLLKKVCEFKSDYRKLVREIENLKNMQAVQHSISLIKEIFYIKDVQVLIKKVKNMELKVLFSMLDYLRFQLKLGVIIFINCSKNNRIHLIVGVTDSLINSKRINALDIINNIKNVFGGKGWGRSDFAQAGINGIAKISTLISEVNSLLHSKL